MNIAKYSREYSKFCLAGLVASSRVMQLFTVLHAWMICKSEHKRCFCETSQCLNSCDAYVALHDALLFAVFKILELFWDCIGILFTISQWWLAKAWNNHWQRKAVAQLRRGARGDFSPRAQNFGGAKLRSGCYVIITKCQISADF